MTDPTPEFEPHPHPGGRGPAGPPDLSIDLGGFLPEGTTLADASGAAESSGADEDTTSDGVDLRGLERLEADLIGVDAAIEAIDADDHARSPLLQELLAEDPGASGLPGD